MKAYKYIKIVIFLITFSKNGIGQENCKCELAPKLIPNIIKNFNIGNLDSAAYFIKQFNNSSNIICKLDYLDGLAQIAISKKQFEVAANYLSEEYKLVRKLQCNNKPIIRYYNTLSKYYTETNNLDSTVKTALEIIKLASEQEDKYGLARALLNAGAIFSELKEYTKAGQYFKQAYDIAKQQKDTTIICAALVRLSSNYTDLFTTNNNQYLLDSSSNFSTAALTIARYPQDFIESTQAYSNLSKYYNLQKKFKEGIQYADSIIYKSPKGVHDFDRFLMLAYERKSEALFELKNYTSSLNMADSALHYALLFNKQLSIYPLELIYKNAKVLNNDNKALWAYEKMTQTKDSIFSLEKNKIIQELEKKYNQAKNEKLITELSQQKKIYLLLIVAAISIIVIVIFYLRQQKLKHQQIIMETEQRLNRARMNPHFFFNTLASLQSFALTENDNINLAANISKFSHIMRETLESTYKEYVTIEQEIDFLNEYLELQKLRFPNRFSFNIHADKMLEIDVLQIPSMIIQPFIENAIEHGLKGIEYSGIIDVFFKQYKEELMIEIIDNGNGLSTVAKENGEHISRASQIIKDRIYLLNIKLKTKAGFMLDNNADGKGVAVKIRLPLLYK